MEVAVSFLLGIRKAADGDKIRKKIMVDKGEKFFMREL
jgi:hypothetical protein